jgi:site-specific DNA-methyltransferase (adenine-specific)
MERIIEASTEEGDVVWEPFGGLCTATVASKIHNREARSAEIVDHFYEAAVERVRETDSRDPTEGDSQSGLEDWE